MMEKVYQEFYSQSLNKAWDILQAIQEEKHNKSKLIVPAFCYALICYGRPFKSSNDTNNKKYFLKIDEINFPNEYQILHTEIIKIRDTVLAHKDLSEYEPKVVDDMVIMKLVYEHSLIDKLKDIIQLVEFVLDYVYGLQKMR